MRDMTLKQLNTLIAHAEWRYRDAGLNSALRKAAFKRLIRLGRSVKNAMAWRHRAAVIHDGVVNAAPPSNKTLVPGETRLVDQARLLSAANMVQRVSSQPRL